MASIRPRASVDFTPDPDKLPAATGDFSQLAWELLTNGVTRKLLGHAIKAYYYRVIRPVWADAGYPDDDAVREYLEERGLTAAMYTCKLRIGEAVKDKKEPEDLLAILAAKAKEKDADTLIRRYAPFVPELYVKVPMHEKGVLQGRATARSITRLPGEVKDEEVHIKWGTDMERMKSLYHEAQMYDRLKNLQLTPKFYGFYQKFSGEDTFAISVFEHSDVFSVEAGDSATLMYYFMRAAQKLHSEGIYHGALLRRSKEDGVKFELTDNVRVRVLPDSTGPGKQRIVRRVLFVNFENSYRHKGRSCPSTNKNLEIIEGGGCEELDNIYEHFRPWRLPERDMTENSVISSIE